MQHVGGSWLAPQICMSSRIVDLELASDVARRNDVPAQLAQVL